MKWPWSSEFKLERALNKLRSNNPKVQSKSAEILGQIGLNTSAVREALLQAILSPYRDVRLEAYAALGKIRPGRAVLRHIASIAERDHDEFIRTFFAQSAREQCIRETKNDEAELLTAVKDIPAMWDLFRMGASATSTTKYTLEKMIAMCGAEGPLLESSFAALKHVLSNPALHMRSGATGEFCIAYGTQNRDQWRDNSDIRCKCLKQIERFGEKARSVVMQALTIAAESYDEAFIHNALETICRMGLSGTNQIEILTRSAVRGIGASNPANPFRNRPKTWASDAIAGLGNDAVPVIEELLTRTTNFDERNVLENALFLIKTKEKPSSA